VLEKVSTKFIWLGSRSVSESGRGRFHKSDSDPDKNHPDPQHWFKLSVQQGGQLLLIDN
jgi:hypothetical protein